MIQGTHVCMCVYIYIISTIYVFLSIIERQRERELFRNQGYIFEVQFSPKRAYPSVHFKGERNLRV